MNYRTKMELSKCKINLPIQAAGLREKFEYILQLQVKQKKGNLIDFARGVSQILTDLFEEYLKNVLGTDIRRCCVGGDIPKLKRDKLPADVLEFYNSIFGGEFRDNTELSSSNIVPYIEYMCKIEKKTDVVDVIPKLRDFEREFRNYAAHEIISITDISIKQKIGFDSNGVLNHIKKLFEATFLRKFGSNIILERLRYCKRRNNKRIEWEIKPMLASLKMEIIPQSKERYTYNVGSLLQGVLMQNMNTEYAEYLHIQGVNPYSQTFEKTDKGYFWTVNTLNKEAKNEILTPLLDKRVDTFHIKHKNENFNIVGKQYIETDYEKLYDVFHSNEKQDNIIKFELITPTSFKSNGQYEFLPDIKLIYQSLMNRYHTFCQKFEMKDYEVLLELVQDTKIIDYKLRSARFHLEGIKIPSYMGSVVVRVNGADTMVSLAKLLFSFGEYSGVGIKTSIGMGGIRLL